MALNTSNRCEYCGGVVRNIPGRQLSLERLTEIHDETCPGLIRIKKEKKT